MRRICEWLVSWQGLGRTRWFNSTPQVEQKRTVTIARP
jgi:hypothetical protein